MSDSTFTHSVSSFGSINTVPSIGGITAVTDINDTTTATPFSKITLIDNDVGAILTVAIRLDVAAKGRFTAPSLIASGFSSVDGGLTYTHVAATPAQLQTAMQMLVYQPTANRVAVGGTETTVFTISVSDGIAPAVSNNSTTVVSTSINDVPVAINDTLATTEDAAVIYSAAQLLGNDKDADGNLLTIASVTSGSGGAVALNTDGSVIFIPHTNFNGVASFAYTVTDGMSTSNSATVTVNVAAVNDIPVAVDDMLATAEDTAVTFSAASLLANDSDVESPLTIAAVTNGRVVMEWNYNWDAWQAITYSTGGTAVLNADGTVTFTPDNNFNGVASFTYTVSDGLSISNSATVTVNVAAVNDAPVVNNHIFTTIEDTGITYSVSDLLSNDIDAEGDALNIVAVANGAGGKVALSADQTTLMFTPDVNFNGSANFTYTISDGKSISNSGTVMVEVAAVNDAPIASNDTLSATQYFASTYNVSELLANDTDVDGNALTIADVTNGTGGTVVLSSDQTTLTFTPNANFSGVADFTYHVTDGVDVSNSATVKVDVMSFKNTVIAVNDILAATENRSVIYTAAQLLGNDIHEDGKSLNITGVTNGSVTMVWNYGSNAWEAVTISTGGTAVLNADNTITFTPDSHFNGVASFTYTASDGTNTSNNATVTVNVASVVEINTVNVTDFKLGTGVSTEGVNQLDLASTLIAANTNGVNGVDAGVIHSHSISNGIISFDDIDSYATPLTITAASNLANVLDYLQANITDNNTVAFVSEGNTFVFQDGGMTDTLVELVGVSSSSINTSGLVAGSIWLV